MSTLPDTRVVWRSAFDKRMHDGAPPAYGREAAPERRGRDREPSCPPQNHCGGAKGRKLPKSLANFCGTAILVALDKHRALCLHSRKYKAGNRGPPAETGAQLRVVAQGEWSSMPGPDRTTKKPVSAKPEIGAYWVSFNCANRPICTDASRLPPLKP